MENLVISSSLMPLGKNLSHSFGAFRQGISLFVLGLIVKFYRPIDQRGDRVPPALLAYHRSKYHFQNPYCFCSLLKDDIINRETAVHVSTEGAFRNQFVAACATNECLYLGVSF